MQAKNCNSLFQSFYWRKRQAAPILRVLSPFSRVLAMGGASATIFDMAKTQKGKGRPSTGRRQTVPVYARIDPALAKAFNEYVDSLEPKTSASAMVELLIKRLLRELSLWPDKEGEA